MEGVDVILMGLPLPLRESHSNRAGVGPASVWFLTMPGEYISTIVMLVPLRTSEGTGGMVQPLKARLATEMSGGHHRSNWWGCPIFDVLPSNCETNKLLGLSGSDILLHRQKRDKDMSSFSSFPHPHPDAG